MTSAGHVPRGGCWVGAVMLLAWSVALAVDARAQSLERGQALYENHCQVCHTAQVHGRKGRVAFSVAELREIVQRWQQNQGLRWSREEIEDVVHYLATTRYHFTSSLGRSP